MRHQEWQHTQWRAESLRIIGSEYEARLPSLSIDVDRELLSLRATAADHERLAAEVGLPEALVPSFLENISIDLLQSDRILLESLDRLRSRIKTPVREQLGLDEIRIFSFPTPEFQAFAKADQSILVFDTVVRQRHFDAALCVLIASAAERLAYEPGVSHLRAAIRHTVRQMRGDAPLWASPSYGQLVGQEVVRLVTDDPSMFDAAMTFSQHLLDFVVAHELGHHACGHLGVRRQGTPHDWECEADLFAVELMRAVRGLDAMIRDRLYVLLPIAVGLLELDNDIDASVRATSANPEQRPQWFDRIGRLAVWLAPPLDGPVGEQAVRDLFSATRALESIWRESTWCTR